MAQIKDALCIPPVIMDVYRGAAAQLKTNHELLNQVAFDIFQHAPNYDPRADYQEAEIAVDYWCGQALLTLFGSGSPITPEGLIELTQKSLTTMFSN